MRSYWFAACHLDYKNAMSSIKILGSSTSWYSYVVGVIRYELWIGSVLEKSAKILVWIITLYCQARQWFVPSVV